MRWPRLECFEQFDAAPEPCVVGAVDKGTRPASTRKKRVDDEMGQEVVAEICCKNREGRRYL